MKWAIFAISAFPLCAKNRGENVDLLSEKNNKNLCLLAETTSLMSCLYAFFSKQAS